MTIEEARQLKRTDLVQMEYSDGKKEVLEFKYIGQTGKAVLCKPGERSTQDSYAVDPKFIKYVL